ncbi:hypothetical protein FOCC_FOCC001306 [Frankliniella occidentalis]|nr:hypothetical protein FOCC_FOCC001306 [Frankliniella occidentalis]
MLEVGPQLLALAAAALVCGALALLALVNLYCFLTLGVYRGKERMEGKTVIVTGANSGIGRITATELARKGAKVIMACRTLETANKARDEIIKETNNQSVIVQKLDLGSFESIREFAAEIIKTEPRLDVLVHNAGMANTFGRKTSPDGIEITMATNHYGPFLLTHLLIGKIVVVASELYKFASVDFNNMNPTRKLPAYLYYVSKYANILFTNELARRLEGTGVTANCLHPGMIDSGIWRNVPFPLNLPMKLICKTCFKTPQQGAQTTLYLACSEEVEGISGKYFMDCKEHSLSRGASDMDSAKKCWEASESLVKLQPTDPKI